jgi:tRNA(Ile)-lysidine synthase
MDLLREESRLIEAVLHETAEKKPRTKGGLRKLEGSEFGLAIERRKIHRELLGLHIQPSFQLVERLRLKGKSDFPEAGPTKREVARDIDGSLLVRDCLTTAFDGEQELICLEEEGEVTFEGVQLRWEITGLPKQLPNRVKPAVGCELFDATKVGHSIVLRHWRPGDRFQPIGMTNPVKLQDLFVNQKIPRANRHKLLIAATPAGEIVWVEGLRISERFKLDKGSLRRLKWTWCRL